MQSKLISCRNPNQQLVHEKQICPPHNPAHPWPAVAGWCMTCWHLCNARAKHTTAAGISKSKAHKSSTSPTSWEARLEEMRYITEMQSRSSYMQSRVGGGLLKSRSQSSLLDPPSLITSSCHWALTCMRSLCSVSVFQCYSVTVLPCYSGTDLYVLPVQNNNVLLALCASSN